MATTIPAQLVALERRAAALVESISDDMPPAEARRIEAEHRQVLAEIEELRRRHGEQLDFCRRQGLATSLADLDDGAFRRRALDELVTRSESTPIFGHAPDGAGPAARDPVAEAIYCRLSGRQPSEPARPLMHRSIVDLMRHHLAATGVSVRGLDTPDAVIRTAMTTRGGFAGMHTTSDFSQILGSAVERRLGDLFTLAQSGAPTVAAPGTARDFRPIREGRLTSFPALERVNEAGEITWGTLDETGETLAIASFARGITISFQALINDDLGAIDRSLRDIAFAAAQLKARLIVAALDAVLGDGMPLFHADHGNLAASGGAPSESTLSAGRVALAKQTPPGSTEPLGLTPAILLVPAELQTAAEKLTASINPASSDDVSVFSGKLQVAVEPRLPTATEWYLFADPMVYPVIRFLTLDGFEVPRIEIEDEFTRLGTSYRVHWHVGAAAVDHRGAWRNPGA